jgi:hypothetical protein|tara:strand:+ start:452 stop:1426 length:975 start_codon:yes stop_codon:yes gene_type:complete
MEYTRVPTGVDPELQSVPQTFKPSAVDMEQQADVLFGKATGCQNGWMPTKWNRQEWSFVLSWLVQVGVLTVSLVAMQKEGIPEVLTLVLLLETIIQGIEITWYTSVGLLYVCGRASIDVGYRYLDWAISTPLMLITLMFFGLWEANRCVRNEDLLGYDSSRVWALVVIIACDWLMLLVGAAYANAKPDGTGMWARLARFYDWLIFWTKRKGDGLFIGWIFFFGAFTPLFVMIATDHFKIGGQLSIILSFCAWSVYGVVAVAKDWSKSITSLTANTLYNYLDIISKNIMGIVVAIVVLNGDYKPADLQCTWVENRPWELSVVGNA